MSSEDKPEQRPTSPRLEAADPKGDQSSPDMGSLDSSWGDDDDLDEDATRVAKIPHDLVALSRRGSALEKDVAPPEKHEAITARPPPVEAPRQGPPIETAVASVVVDAPHEQLPPLASASVAAADEDDEDEEDDDEPNADELDAGWDVEEEKAAAADVAAGLDAEARRKAAEQRAVARKEKGRAKVLAAKEKRKARAEAVRQKQKKPRKRSVPPPAAGAAASKSSRPPPKAEATPASREHPTIPPTESKAPVVRSGAQRDLLRMIFIVALVVALGALAIGIMRR